MKAEELRINQGADSITIKCDKGDGFISLIQDDETGYDIDVVVIRKENLHEVITALQSLTSSELPINL